MKNNLLSIVWLAVCLISFALLLVSCETPHVHSFGNWTIQKEANCALEGVRVGTCSCGAESTEAIPKVAHIGGEWIIDDEPDCTSEGSRHQICSNCGETVNTEAIAAVGHEAGEWIVDADADCTHNGTKHQACVNCGETVKTAIIFLKGHQAGEWQTQDEPTCHQLGSAYKSCSVCGETVETRILPYAHQYENGACVCGEPKPSEGLSFMFTTTGYAVTGMGSCTDTRLVIPAYYDYQPVIAIASNALRDADIDSVYIPATVEEIGELSFPSFSITEVVFAPGSRLKIIGESAFYGSKFTSIVLPEGLEVIEDGAFHSCDYLQKIIFPSTLREIGKNAFRYCQSINQVVIKDMASWCSISFENNYANPCKAGEGYLYDANEELIEHLQIPDDVTSISSFAFCDVTCLKSITFPEGLKEIAADAFVNCSGILQCYIPSILMWCQVKIANSDALPRVEYYVGGELLTSLVIPASVATVPAHSFAGCQSLASVILENGVTAIGAGAFSGCPSLIAITLPESLTQIGESAFRGCTSLIAITLPESLTQIGESAFRSCTGLKEMHIPASVVYIGKYAFTDCSGFTAFTFACQTGWSYLNSRGEMKAFHYNFSSFSKIIEYINDLGYCDWYYTP